MKKYNDIINNVKIYYNNKIDKYGPNYRGVDWNSKESQELRFKQLLKVCNRDKKFTINDFGCGYGYLAYFMLKEGYNFEYLGIDISDKMIIKAKELYGKYENINFIKDCDISKIADYTVASGIFNVKLKQKDSEWLDYILKILHKMSDKSKCGFSFNCLTIYSETEFLKDYLYYADPCFLFDYCKKNFSKNVALLHDYFLYEFTIIVRK